MDSSCAWRGLGWKLGEISTLEGLSSPGTAVQESPSLQGDLTVWIWPLGTWGSSGLGSAG